MFPFEHNLFQKIEEQLAKNCPSPEDDLIRLSKIASDFPESVEGEYVRHVIYDIDDLIAQTRWHLGQALLLMDVYSNQLGLSENGEVEDKSEFDQIIEETGIPTKALLLLRGYIARSDHVMYTDYSSPRQSGTVAGWVFHMMIDNSIYRVIAALDRLAHVLWFAAGLSFTKDNNKVRVYYRSGKLKLINEKINSPSSEKLLEIAKGPLLDYVISYRDGFAHDVKVKSIIAGSLPSQQYPTVNGDFQAKRLEKWPTDLLFGLGNATYHQLLEALNLTVSVLGDKFLETDDQAQSNARST